jgi:hypothetical protein
MTGLWTTVLGLSARQGRVPEPAQLPYLQLAIEDSAAEIPFSEKV